MTAVESPTPSVEAVVADLIGRLTAVVDVVADLTGADAGGLNRRARAAAPGLIAALTGPDPEQARSARAGLERLVDLDDPVDAGSPLGITLGRDRDDVVTQAWAADALGVSRARVAALAGTGQLTVVEIDGTRLVSRASVADRLAARAVTR
jgi:hypothetical protein